MFVPQIVWAGLLPSEVAVKVAEWQFVSVEVVVRGPGITNSWNQTGAALLSSAIKTQFKAPY